MNSNCGVYCIRCKVNNKAYIGSSVDIKKRWNDHKGALRRGKHPNKQLQEDYNKYGADNFLYTILTNCKPQKLLWYENMYILLFNTRDMSMGYNIAKATRPLQTLKPPHKPRGSKPSQEVKKRKVRKEAEIPPRMLQRIQCIETGEIMTKYEACNKGKDYGNLKLHLIGIAENYNGYHWRYVYRR